MALDSNYAARWAWTKLIGDATLVTLLGGANVFRRVALRGTTGAVVVVEVVSTSEREGAIKTGPNTHTATALVLRTSIWHQNSNDLVEQVAARIDVLLDGAVLESYDGGMLYSCIRGQDIPRDMQEGDVSYIGWDILWNVVAKAA
jgi:hypothetical protein